MHLSFDPITTTAPRDGPPPHIRTCPSCMKGRVLIYGLDPDGFVLCGECGWPRFYCDIGGEG